jgi:hypothetical protein
MANDGQTSTVGDESNASRRVQDFDLNPASEGEDLGDDGEHENSPKGHKRARANTGGDSRPVGSQVKEENTRLERNTIVRDSDG